MNKYLSVGGTEDRTRPIEISVYDLNHQANSCGIVFGKRE